MIDKIDVTEFNKTGEIKIKHFGKEEGFTGLECNSNATFVDKEGGIWFGSINGAIHYDPSRDLINKTEPITHITGLNLFFEKFDWAKFSSKTDEKTPQQYCGTRIGDADQLLRHATCQYKRNHSGK